MKAAPKKAAPELKDAHLGRILETTKRLLGEIGAEQMTIRGLAAESKVAPATLYNRFGGKDKLISLAVIDHYERNVRTGFLKHEGSGSPLENFCYGLKLLAKTCQENPAFARTVVSMYFKVGNHVEMPKAMYGALYDTWLLLLQDMRSQGSLRDWVSLEALSAELCERTFAVVLKWAKDEIPDKTLLDRMVFSALCILLGASSGAQAQPIEDMLQKLLNKPGLKLKPAARSMRATKRAD